MWPFLLPDSAERSSAHRDLGSLGYRRNPDVDMSECWRRSCWRIPTGHRGSTLGVDPRFGGVGNNRTNLPSKLTTRNPGNTIAELSVRIGEWYVRMLSSALWARAGLELDDFANASRHAVDSLTAAQRIRHMGFAGYALDVWAIGRARRRPH